VTSYTVTATNTDGSSGVYLQVEVITGAAEAGGASGSVDNGIANGTGSGTAFTVSLTPSSSGSFIAWAASEASASFAAISGAANNKLLTVSANADSFEDTTNGCTPGAGYYSGSVTSGTPVTVGASNTGVSTSGPQLAVYEVKPSPSWSEDPSTPAWVKVTGTNAATTASFTPPGGSVLVAVVSCNFSGTNTGNKISVSSTPALTWTLRASNSLQSNNGGTAIYTATVPGGGAVASKDVPQVFPGPTWLDIFKSGMRKPRPPQPALTSSVVNCSGGLALAPLAFQGQGAVSSWDTLQINPGTTWLSMFKGWVPKPEPVPPVVQGINVAGSFTLAPLAFAANGSQSSPDVPQFQPGPYWLSWFKPGIYKPVPPLPAVQGVNATGSFTLASLAFQGQGSQSSPDIPNILPGTTWLDLFKPGFPKPRPVPPVVQGINATGSFTLASLAFTVSGSQSSPDVPQVQPGPTWLALFRQVQKPLPWLMSAPSQGVSGTGSFSFAPLAFNGQGSQSSPDQPQIQPGTTWIRLFRPDLHKPVPVPPAQQAVNSTGSFALAPLALAGNGAQSSPDQRQILPGTTWLDLFKPGMPKPRPAPPALQGINGTGDLALAPLAFAAQGAIAGAVSDQPQINPGYRWLALFKHWQRPSGSPSLAVPRNTESGSFNIYLPGGCIRFGTPVITLPALKVTLQGYAGRFGPLTVALPSPAVSLTGLHFPRWPGVIIPSLRVSLTGKVYHSVLSIVLPPPEAVLTGQTVHVHSGPFNLSLTCRSGMMTGLTWLGIPPLPEDPPDWLLGQAKSAWKTSLLWKGWTVGYASVSLSHLATQYVLVPVQAMKNGSTYNPGSDPVQFAFAPTPTYVPQSGDWVSGSWVTVSTNLLYPYSAQCLVGPSGAITLGIGSYVMYVKISDSPETPVLIAGQLEIT
jgi:hypothetical protein